MGVLRLSTFFKTKLYHIGQSIALSQGHAVLIDGYALVYHLYGESHLEWLHGGEYLAFAKYVYEFFTCLQHVQVTMVFDGCTHQGKAGMLNNYGVIF